MRVGRPRPHPEAVGIDGSAAAKGTRRTARAGNVVSLVVVLVVFLVIASTVWSIQVTDLDGHARTVRARLLKASARWFCSRGTQVIVTVIPSARNAASSSPACS